MAGYDAGSVVVSPRGGVLYGYVACGHMCGK